MLAVYVKGWPRPQQRSSKARGMGWDVSDPDDAFAKRQRLI
jgi:hypothetical protein